MKVATRNIITESVAIFVGMAIVFAALALASKGVGDPFAQGVMLSTGSAAFGSGLTFFLIHMFAERGKS